MPIRKEMRHLYPPRKEWKRLRAEVLASAGNRCECRGECGHRHYAIRCDAPNGSTIWRETVDGRLMWSRQPAHASKLVQIVLTTAHLDHDPTNNDPANLRAFCQLCHLRYDGDEHRANAAATRQRKRDQESGQVPLLGAEHLGFQKGNG